MGSKMAKRRTEDDGKSNHNIQQSWGRKTDVIAMEKDSNKVTTQRSWIKIKTSGKPKRYFHTKHCLQSIYTIVKKIQNMQTTGMKNISMDNIIMNAILEKQKQIQIFWWCRKMLSWIMAERLPNRNQMFKKRHNRSYIKILHKMNKKAEKS